MTAAVGASIMVLPRADDGPGDNRWEGREMLQDRRVWIVVAVVVLIVLGWAGGFFGGSEPPPPAPAAPATGTSN